VSRATPWGEIPDDATVQVGRHTHVYYGPRAAFSNSAIVVGEDGVLVFDANDVSCGREVRAAAERCGGGRPLRYLVLSHTHSDHAHGAHYFAPPARVLARAWAQQRLQYWSQRDLQPFIDETPQYAEEYRKIRIVIPDTTVEQVTHIPLGGVTVRLEPVDGVAHTPADLLGVVEEDGIALCGDVLFSRCATYLGNGSVQGELAALDHLRGLGMPLHVPGHGPVCGPGAIEEAVAFVAAMREAVRDGLAAGLSGDRLVDDVRRRRMARWRDLPFFNEPWMIPDNVEAVAKELQENR